MVSLHHCIPEVICKCHTLVKAVSVYTQWNCVLAVLQIIIINYAPLCVHGQVVVVVYFYVKHPVMSCRHIKETDTISITYIVYVFSY